MDRTAGELHAVESPAVDVEKLQRRVRERAASLRSAPGVAPAAGPPDRHLVAGPAVHPVAVSAEIVPYQPVPGGPLAVAARRAVRRALRWYLWPVTARLSEHNGAVASVLAEHRRALTWLRLEGERLDRDIAVSDERQGRR